MATSDTELSTINSMKTNMVNRSPVYSAPSSPVCMNRKSVVKVG